MNMDENKRRRNMLLYILIAVVAYLAISQMLFPSLTSSQTTEVSYSEFLQMVDNKQVTQVQKTQGDATIYFTTGTGINQQTYSTVIFGSGDGLNEKLEASGVEMVGKIADSSNDLWLYMLISYGLPILMFIFIGWYLNRRMKKAMGDDGPSMNFGGGFGMGGGLGKANAKEVKGEETGVTFKDVAGQDEAKESLEEIVGFLKSPEKYNEIGARCPRGALLVGPPGTGKTLLAKAVAGEAGVPFFQIAGSEFVEMFVGMGAAKVRDLFKQANEKAPCIVFIDEIDTIGKKRDGSGMGGNDEREQTLNQLLTEMDGFDGRKGVVILAATNRPETLDKALLRPGRFDRRIPVELPDLKGREAILRVHGRDVKMDESVDFNAIARATVGASGAELANIVNEGALRAVRMGHRVVSQADLEESVETVIAGYQKKNASVSENERRIVAYHEIGHALVAACQSNSAPVHKITIIPRTSGALGYTMQVEDGERLLMSKEEALNKIATLTGGRAAEEFMFHSITTGASNDIEQATKLARAMVTRYGMSDQFGMVALETVTNQYLGGDTSLACSPETAKAIDDEVITTVKAQYEKAMGILRDHAAKLNELAGYLLEKETITGEEFMEILNR